METKQIKHLTLVFNCPLSEDADQLLRSGNWTAASWSHAIRERDYHEQKVVELESKLSEMLDVINELTKQTELLKSELHLEKFKVQA